MIDENIDPERFRARLLERRDELIALRDVRADATQVVELDQQRTGRLSRMDALQGQAMAQASQERVELELRRIAGALARIDCDDYGRCLDCEEQIAPARLEVDPAATLCIGCASKRD